MSSPDEFLDWSSSDGSLASSPRSSDSSSEYWLCSSLESSYMFVELLLSAALDVSNLLLGEVS